MLIGPCLAFARTHLGSFVLIWLLFVIGWFHACSLGFHLGLFGLICAHLHIGGFHFGLPSLSFVLICTLVGFILGSPASHLCLYQMYG